MDQNFLDTVIEDQTKIYKETDVLTDKQINRMND